MITRTDLDKGKLFLAVISLLFALFNTAYSYGFMLVERYREFYPPEIRFELWYEIYFDIVIKYLIISGCYFLYILFIKKEQNVLNQILSFLLLLIVLYQTGVYSFIIDKVEVPGRHILWAKEVFSPTFLYTINCLQVLFWGIGIVLAILQVVTIWQAYKIHYVIQKGSNDS